MLPMKTQCNASSSTTGLFVNTTADLVILARTTPAISPTYLMSDQDVHRSMFSTNMDRADKQIPVECEDCLVTCGPSHSSK